MFSASDLEPRSNPAYLFCLRNDGSAVLSLTAASTDLVDTDAVCTGDEADWGDATCGGGQDGELAVAMSQVYRAYDCGEPTAYQSWSSSLSDSVSPHDLGTISPGETRCFTVELYGPGGGEEQLQQAQSDQVSWRYTFTGQA